MMGAPPKERNGARLINENGHDPLSCWDLSNSQALETSSFFVDSLNIKRANDPYWTAWSLKLKCGGVSTIIPDTLEPCQSRYSHFSTILLLWEDSASPPHPIHSRPAVCSCIIETAPPYAATLGCRICPGKWRLLETECPMCQRNLNHFRLRLLRIVIILEDAHGGA